MDGATTKTDGTRDFYGQSTNIEIETNMRLLYLVCRLSMIHFLHVSKRSKPYSHTWAKTVQREHTSNTGDWMVKRGLSTKVDGASILLTKRHSRSSNRQPPTLPKQTQSSPYYTVNMGYETHSLLGNVHDETEMLIEQFFIDESSETNVRELEVSVSSICTLS